MLLAAILREIFSEISVIIERNGPFLGGLVSLFSLSSVSVFLHQVSQALLFDLQEIRNRSIVIGTRVLGNAHLRLRDGNCRGSVCRFGFTPVIIDPHCS